MIAQSIDKRQFRADNYEIDIFLPAEMGNTFQVIHMDGYIFSDQGGSGVTGCHVKRLGERALPDFPGQRVFAASIANKKDIHAGKRTKDSKPRTDQLAYSLRNLIRISRISSSLYSALLESDMASSRLSVSELRK